MNPCQSFAIVPAAGRSQRMGTSKLLLPWQGATLIDALLEAWQQSNVGRVVVVARREDTALLERLAERDIDLVLPTLAPPEMKDSVAAALTQIQQRYNPRPTDAWLLAPADMPRLSCAVINRVLAAANATPAEIIVPCANGDRGHPVLFRWSVGAAVHGLGDDQGVNALLRQFPVTEVDCDAAASWVDVDRPDDYRQLAETVDCDDAEAAAGHRSAGKKPPDPRRTTQ